MAEGYGGKDKGFSGLSSMVSNVEDLEIEANLAQSNKDCHEPMVAADDGRQQMPTGPIKKKQERDWSGLGEWVTSNASKLIYVLLFGAFLYWLNLPDNSTPTSSTPAVSTGSGTSTSSPASSPSSSTPSSTSFEKPPIGTTTFSAANIRWALREEIKLDTIRDLVTTDAGIDAFNVMVDDYNSRAGEYRYYQADMDRAKRDVENIRSQIVSEAVAEARRIDR